MAATHPGPQKNSHSYVARGPARGLLGRFLRSRREAMQPAEVGLPGGGRRRTPGLRREEVAMPAGVSADYYERFEQARAVRPSEQIIACLARALRLSVDERDYLYRLACYQPPPPFVSGGYVDPALMYLLDALPTTPAVVADNLSHVIAQNDLARTLLGDWTGRKGRDSNVVWRWFTDPSSRTLYAPEDHQAISRAYAADLRAVMEAHAHDQTTAGLVDDLLEHSTQFAELWDEREVAVLRSARKTIVHPAVGRMVVHCDIVRGSSTSHILIMFRPQPGSDAAEKFAFLRSWASYDVTLRCPTSGLAMHG
ncbi:helix-turn-helix transcriptional regulator [Streptomyces cadmiisoli]|uniref:helix-turn-helix transcriptional regulator n=1 Tax=Streptomyces cadmiisoli TaxID=2184053 RepID=UPI003D716CDA